MNLLLISLLATQVFAFELFSKIPSFVGEASYYDQQISDFISKNPYAENSSADTKSELKKFEALGLKKCKSYHAGEMDPPFGITRNVVACDGKIVAYLKIWRTDSLQAFQPVETITKDSRKPDYIVKTGAIYKIPTYAAIWISDQVRTTINAFCPPVIIDGKKENISFHSCRITSLGVSRETEKLAESKKKNELNY